MKVLIFVPQPLQNASCALNPRLVHHDRLKTPRQRRVALKIFFVFLERRRANNLDFAARQRRFQNIRRVDGSFRRPRADKRVQLVDEQDHFAVPANLLDDTFQALLKFAAVLSPRHDGRHGKRHDPFIRQHIRHRPGDDRLCQSFGDSRLAHARLADEDRIVLRPARQNLNNPLNLLFPTDNGIHFILRRHIVQRASVAIEKRRRRLFFAPRPAGFLLVLLLRRSVQKICHRPAHRVKVCSQSEQNARRSVIVLAQKPQ